MDPRQLWGPRGTSEWLATYTQATDLLLAVFGLFIAYHAYRGYRTNESRPMLYISLGFVLVLALPFVLLVASQLLPFLPAAVVAFVIQTMQVLGVAAILYGFRLPG